MSADASSTKPERPTASRLPSLNQLAARINAAQSPTAPPARPRLAAALLRTNSTMSIASVADSVAVNAPSTRATSPSAGASSAAAAPEHATTPPPGVSAGEPLTSSNVEELEQKTSADGPVSTEKKIRGYKNIPSLDAITARLAKAKTLSVDGTAKPPDADMIDDPKTPGVRVKAKEHPLEHNWIIYHDQKAPYAPGGIPMSATSEAPPPSAHPLAADQQDYEAGLTVIGEFETVESFCRYFNWLKPPSKLERNSNYHLFKAGIKPMWEDPANSSGGKWVLTMKNNPPLLDRCWAWAAMALIGEELDEADELCGLVVSLRAKVDRIQLWTRSKEDVEKLNAIAKRMVKILDISEADNIGLEFQFNSEDRPPLNKFISIQSMPVTGYRQSFRNSPASGPGEGPSPIGGGGFRGGAFGAGGGGGVLGGGPGAGAGASAGWTGAKRG